MTKNELLHLFDKIKVFYPTFKIPSIKTEKETVLLWYSLLKRFDYGTVFEALINTSKVENYCLPGKILAECEELDLLLTNAPELNENNILHEIKQAIDFSNINANFNALSPIAKAVIVEPNYLKELANVPITERETIIIPQLKKLISQKIKDYLKIRNAVAHGLSYKK